MAAICKGWEGVGDLHPQAESEVDAKCFVRLPLGNLSAGLLYFRHFPLHTLERVQYANGAVEEAVQ